VGMHRQMNFLLVYRSALADISKVTAHERIQHLYYYLFVIKKLRGGMCIDIQ
jgi:hypothetical protein